MTDALELRDAGRTFGGVTAAASLTVSVDRGSVLAVCGPNGAGKTTLINLATGVLAPSSGAVAVDGVDLTGRPPRSFARAGVVRTFQSIRLFEGMTALDNVLVGAARGQRPPVIGALLRPPRFRQDERLLHQRSRAALDRLGIGFTADRVVAELSHGQRRRVELARAIASVPRYLVLDEPGAGVDPETVEVLVDVITELARTGVGVVVVEHDTRLLSRVAHRAVALVSGRIVSAGTFAEVTAQAGLAAPP